MKKLKFPRLVYNKVSFAGVALAAISGSALVFFLVFEQMGHGDNPYLGIFTYMILPPILLLGIVLIPVGIIRLRRILKTKGDQEVPRWPYIDMAKKTHRNAFIVFIGGTMLFAMITIVGGYQAYHFTESIAFCGTTCHEVMKPEYVAYANSPHAKVLCAACHVGEGASWYAKSKLSGAYQVMAVMLNSYPQPIPTPISNLRPAQETCEKCHWPEKFFGAMQRQFNHYMYDKANRSWPINMLIKVGGGDPKTGQTAGIHWHMNIGMRIEYIHRDEGREDIPWMKVTDQRTGRVTIYQDEDEPLTEEEIRHATPRVMDCMDCHNRPSHKFRSPDYAIDRAILTGQIDVTLPEIKRVAVEAMSAEYLTEDGAIRKIASSIHDFYRQNHPELFKEKRVAVDQAVVATQEQFKQNIFPEMKVRWTAYRDNIGHFIFPGCMRCHAGNKVSEEGWVITRECTTCHTILAQGSGDRAEMASTPEGLEFIHPEDIDGEWRETGCYECHTGTQP